MTVKNKIISALTVWSLATQLYAEGDIVATDNVKHDNITEEHDGSGFYIIVKGAMIAGDTVPHGHSILDGDKGYGFGIDIGYKFGNGFALEYDFTNTTNTVKEIDTHHHSEEADGTYYTHAFDLVYVHHLSHSVGLFVKGGYEYEVEKIEDFYIDSTDIGFTYGIGLEFVIDDHYAFVTEYEGSTIDGPRGDSVFAGLMNSF